MSLDPRLPSGAELASTDGFNRFVGPVFRLPDLEGGAVRRFCFIAAEKHMNAAGAVHGGMLMAFADMAMSRSSRLASSAQRCSTVSLSCDFAGPGRLNEVVEAHVRVTRVTRSVVFLSTQIVAENRPLMVAQGIWRIA